MLQSKLFQISNNFLLLPITKNKFYLLKMFEYGMEKNTFLNASVEALTQIIFSCFY